VLLPIYFAVCSQVKSAYIVTFDIDLPNSSGGLNTTHWSTSIPIALPKCVLAWVLILIQAPFSIFTNVLTKIQTAKIFSLNAGRDAPGDGALPGGPMAAHYSPRLSGIQPGQQQYGRDGRRDVTEKVRIEKKKRTEKNRSADLERSRRRKLKHRPP
jgi:hypothetical protein